MDGKFPSGTGHYDSALVEQTPKEPSDQAGPAPVCPRCGADMVLRTARRGANLGNQFWGCSTFPKCRSTIALESSEERADSIEDPSGAVPGNSDASKAGEAELGVDAEPLAPDEPLESDELTSGNGRRRLRDKLAGAAIGAFKTYDKVQRFMLEAEEPDASGRWSPEHRRKVLRYVYERDGGRCGVCGAETRIQAAHVEHIVPKIFAYFDVSNAGKAVQGTRYKSQLHKLDNLQASHTYCNKNKGNTADVTRWRHPTMPPLTVALAEDGSEFRVPQQPVKGH